MSGKRSATGAAAQTPLPQTEDNLVRFPTPAAEQSEASLPAPSLEPDDRFEYVPLGMLYESDTNPRRNFDEKGMADLTANVRAHGVLEPLIVRQRPLDGTPLAYEIVAGARRFRAASAAGLEAVPVVIKRSLSDEQMLELQLIENLHRTDLHPLEEATGYQQLIEQMGLDIASVAAKISKSVSYVYQRLKLAALIPDAQQAFYAEEISPGHAILIARLEPADQERCLAAIKQGYATSVRELMRWIEQRVHLDLSAAPFQTDDAGLLPEAGACTNCPKRVGANPALFADLAGDEKKTNICTDPSCYERKIDAHVEQQCAMAKERGEPLVKISTRYSYGSDKPAGDVLSRSQYVVIEKDKDRCPKARRAIVAEGDRTGTVLDVCAASDCKVHFRRTGGVVVQRPERRTTPAEKKERALPAKQREERERQLETAEIERRVRMAVAETVNSKLTRGDIELILASTLHRAWHADLVAAARCFKLDTKSGEYAGLLGKYAKALSDTELNRFLITFLLLQHAGLLADEAKKRKIDVKAIERSVGQANAARNRKAENSRSGKLAEKAAKAPAKLHTSLRTTRRKAS